MKTNVPVVVTGKEHEPGTPPVPYSQRRHTGLIPFANNKVGGSSGGGPTVQLSPQNQRFPLAYIIADPGNTGSIKVGNQGAEVITLNAGDAIPFFDIAPADVWATSATANQIVVFVGTGDPVV